MTDAYQFLAQHLDRLPGGFPATASGVELRILKRLFTPQEAVIAAGLTLMPEPAEPIADRLHMEAKSLAETLYAMSRKGLIFRLTKGEKPLYMAAQFVIGIWEYHVNDLDRDLIADFNEYAPHLMKDTLAKTRTQQLRVVPVSQSLSADMKVMPYEVAEEIIRTQKKIVVAPCICRKEHHMAGKGCDFPLETCFSFGAGAHYYEENGWGRAISQDQALNILKQGIEAGLVLQPGNSQKPVNICMCCGCCCQILKNLKRLDAPAAVVASNWFAAVDETACTACQSCAQRCQMDAITVGETARIDLNRCIGCGLCVAACQFEAMALMEKDPSRRATPPKNTVETYVRIAQERGLF
jgi:electron transport complex protein RnfB